MLTRLARPSELGADTVQTLSDQAVSDLRMYGVSFVVRYLASLSSGELARILNGNLALSLVTYAGSYDSGPAIARLRTLGIPSGATVWLDLEDEHRDAATVTGIINTWAGAIKSAGYEPGLYVGAGQPLDADALYGLAVVRYWHSVSIVPDVAVAGYCMTQKSPPNQRVGCVVVDIDIASPDKLGRLPTFVTT